MATSCSDPGQHDTAKTPISNIFDDFELVLETGRHSSVRRTSWRKVVRNRHFDLRWEIFCVGETNGLGFDATTSTVLPEGRQVQF